MKRESVGGLPAWGEGCSVIVSPVLSSGVRQLGSFSPGEGMISACRKCSSCHAESRYPCSMPTLNVCLLSENTFKSVAACGGNCCTETGIVCSSLCECVCGQSAVILREECAPSPIGICSGQLQMGLPGK